MSSSSQLTNRSNTCSKSNSHIKTIPMDHVYSWLWAGICPVGSSEWWTKAETSFHRRLAKTRFFLGKWRRFPYRVINVVRLKKPKVQMYVQNQQWSVWNKVHECCFFIVFIFTLNKYFYIDKVVWDIIYYLAKQLVFEILHTVSNWVLWNGINYLLKITRKTTTISWKFSTITTRKQVYQRISWKKPYMLFKMLSQMTGKTLLYMWKNGFLIICII